MTKRRFYGTKLKNITDWPCWARNSGAAISATIGKAIGYLVNLPLELKASRQVKALQREANPLIE